MKRLTAFVLALVMLLSLAACGASAPAATEAPAAAVPETTAEPTTEPTTEPTLSAEELFLQSLPEKLQEAYALGIVELELLEDLDRVCTIAEAAGILQNIYRIKFEADSWMLTNTVTE